MEVTATMTDRRPGSAAPRRISILGSTGSIGCSTIDLIERNRDGYVVEALTANNNVERLIEQALSLRPQVAVVAEDRHYAALKDGLAGTGIAVAAGATALTEAASRPVDWTMAGIVGAAGLAPTLAAIRQGAIVAVANKETLVCAGELVLEETRRHGATLLPVDSEHNAIFQVFDFEQAERVSRIILTASGGPFRTWPRERMERATPEEAVAHPNWSMGAKISVDSATLMNKGLEVIEAYYLFPVDKKQIEVVIHPQSVIHSMVEYVDGSVLAQMGTPDMRTPIAFAMGWPHRLPTPSRRLDFRTLGELSFETPDDGRFPALDLAFEALRAGGAAPTVLNAANEIAVGAFLAGRIGFLEIASIVADTLADVPARAIGCLEDVGAVDDEARRKATLLVERATANV